MKTRPSQRRTRSGSSPAAGPWTVGAAIGVVAAGFAIGVAQLVAAFVGEMASPVVAVGQAAIDLAPPFVKDFAISTFGVKDKLVLLSGIGVLIGVLAVAIGILAMRRRWVGSVGLIVFGGLGLLAAVTRPTADRLSVLPSIVGVAAGLGALSILLRSTGTRIAPGPSTGGHAKVVAYDRRRFLLTGLALGGGAAIAGFGSGLVSASTSKAVASRAALRIPEPSDVAPIPSGTGLPVRGLSSFYTPNSTFYRVDTALIVPKVTAQDWRLRIHGMVDREVQMDLAQLLHRRLIERDVTLTCVSNRVGGPYIGNARWIGAPLKPILDEAGVRAGADQLVSRSVDGFTLGTPTAAVMDGRDAMLAVAMNGQPLPLEHGFPVRMVVPGLYGYVSATKWVIDMELTTFDAYDAYWVQRGWAQQAPIKTMSRIDTPRSGQHVPAGRLSVAGVAWAQHKGIAAVEIRIDAGAWQRATLAEQDTIDTWRLWVYEWNAQPGRHTIQVRATDDTGYTQTGEETPPPPNGATGWHTIVVSVA
jgi:DMSO/TMAO reductase YedYZ molybdopterin-dependent catalytic subunit